MQACKTERLFTYWLILTRRNVFPNFPQNRLSFPDFSLQNLKASLNFEVFSSCSLNPVSNCFISGSNSQIFGPRSFISSVPLKTLCADGIWKYTCFLNCVNLLTITHQLCTKMFCGQRFQVLLRFKLKLNF